jgi:hypothetical protein
MFVFFPLFFSLDPLTFSFAGHRLRPRSPQLRRCRRPPTRSHLRLRRPPHHVMAARAQLVSLRRRRPLRSNNTGGTVEKNPARVPWTRRQDTPDSALTMPSFLDDDVTLQLVFSDGFDTDGREFHPFFEAVGLRYWQCVYSLSTLQIRVEAHLDLFSFVFPQNEQSRVVCLASCLESPLSVITDAITFTACRYDPGKAPSFACDSSFRDIFFPFLVSLPSPQNRKLTRSPLQVTSILRADTS